VKHSLIHKLAAYGGLMVLIASVFTVYQNRYYIGIWLFQNPIATWPALISPKLQDFFTLLLSVLIEALPFLVIGVGLSVIIQTFVTTKLFTRIIPKNRILRRLSMSLLGVFAPVCECGNVPVARSLLLRGVKPADVITFLLAAPIINPITIAATAIAFSYDPAFVWWRVAMAFVVAQVIAICFQRLRPETVLESKFLAVCKTPHDHPKTVRSMSAHYLSEFWLMLSMLCLGAAIAAAVQVFVPREILETMAANPLIAILAMIAFGIIISVCSSVDAFVALAYASTFHPAALLAFLVVGPMVDIKMIALLKTTFRTRAIALMAGLIVGLTMVLSLGVWVVYGA